LYKYLFGTGVARNFDWKGLKMEKSYGVSLVRFFGDEITMTSLKWFHNWIF